MERAGRTVRRQRCARAVGQDYRWFFRHSLFSLFWVWLADVGVCLDFKPRGDNEDGNASDDSDVLGADVAAAIADLDADDPMYEYLKSQIKSGASKKSTGKEKKKKKDKDKSSRKKDKGRDSDAKERDGQVKQSRDRSASRDRPSNNNNNGRGRSDSVSPSRRRQRVRSRSRSMSRDRDRKRHVRRRRSRSRSRSRTR